MSSESPFIPGTKVQWAWDAMSLATLQTCPRKYQLSIIEGWGGLLDRASADLEFGRLLHGAQDVFNKAIIGGADKEEASIAAVQWAFENSGSRYIDADDVDGAPDAPPPQPRWVPWGGAYLTQWRCTGTEKYQNEKGNRAKCPNSKVGVWHEGHGLGECNICGSELEVKRNWLPEKRKKSRPDLLRAVAWWCDEQPESYVDRLAPMALADGTPAVELSFLVPTDITLSDGTTVVLCGYLDRVESSGDETLIRDTKTTLKTPGTSYFAAYEPNTQVSLYDLVGSIFLPETRIDGVAIDAIQILDDGVRVAAPRVFKRSEGYREEFYKEIEVWVKIAEQYAKADFWPKAESNCFLCHFKEVCKADPKRRKAILESMYEKRHWNPLKERT